MISYLSGKIVVLGEDFIFLQTSGGVGYSVFCTSSFLAKAAINDVKELFIETIVREDAITLFGFESFKELTWFKSFLKVAGIGAKTGLSILSSFKINDIIFAIENEQKNFFTSVSGIGEKVASRIISEMKKEPKKNTSILTTTLVLNGLKEEMHSSSKLENDIIKDAILALEALGFARNLSYSACIKIINENKNIDLNSIIKLALKNLNTPQASN